MAAWIAETAGSVVLEGLIQRRDKPDSGTYIGRGKVEELKAVVLETGADTVVCDGELSPGQMIALEKALDARIPERQLRLDGPGMGGGGRSMGCDSGGQFRTRRAPW